MKSTITLVSIMLSVIFISSCGQSAEEKAKSQQQQQAREDSIKKAGEVEGQLQFENKQAIQDSIKKAGEEAAKLKLENKQALEDSLQRRTLSLSAYQASLVEAKADLEVAKDKMNSIKEYQLGRTTEERETQIKNQSITISTLETNVKQLEEQIRETEGRISQLKTQLTQI